MSRVSSRQRHVDGAARMFGPAYLVAVGSMDPGSWATDLAAG